MSMLRCDFCQRTHDHYKILFYPVTRNRHACQICVDNDPTAAKCVAQWEDQQSDARLEEAQHDHAAEIYDKYSW